MINNSNSHRAAQAQRSSKSERMKKRQNAQNAIVLMQHENLIQLVHVRSNVEVRQQHTFGISRRSAGKNNRCQIVQLRLSLAPAKPFNRAHGKKYRRKERNNLFPETRL